MTHIRHRITGRFGPAPARSHAALVIQPLVGLRAHRYSRRDPRRDSDPGPHGTSVMPGLFVRSPRNAMQTEARLNNSGVNMPHAGDSRRRSGGDPASCETGVRDMLSPWLQHRGFAVWLAATGGECLDEVARVLSNVARYRVFEPTQALSKAT